MGGHAVHIPIQQDCDSGDPCGPRGLGLELEGGVDLEVGQGSLINCQ